MYGLKPVPLKSFCMGKADTLQQPLLTRCPIATTICSVSGIAKGASHLSSCAIYAPADSWVVNRTR